MKSLIMGPAKVKTHTLLEQFTLLKINPQELNSNILNMDIDLFFWDNSLVNSSDISVLFIIGFILGDGTMYLKLRLTDEGAIWIIPVVNFPQSAKNKYNILFYSKLENFFNNNNIKIFRFDNNVGMSYLKLEGQFTVFEQFFPLLSTSGNPAHNFYWKNYQFDNLKKISLIVKANLHTSLFGIRAILYDDNSNKRIYSKEYWLNKAELFFKFKSKELVSKETYIQVVTRKGEQVAWRVVFPIETNLKNKQFGFSTCGSSELALNKAVEYRNETINNWIKTLE